MIRKGSTRDLEKKLDVLCSRIIRMQTPFCVLCGSAVDLQNGHLFTRAWRPTRWDTHRGGNCASLCERDNQAHERNARPYRDWFIREFGDNAYEELYVRAHSNKKFTYLELTDMVDLYSAVLQELKAA